MTITPWCSIEHSIERPGPVGARETRTRKFVTRVQVMLNSAAIARPLRVSERYRGLRRVDDAGPKVVQFLDRVRDQNANPTSPLNRYIEGWVQTDLEKILDATAPSYRFTDPFVGNFDGRSLHKYFDLLQDGLSCTGAISRRELAFFLQGPMKLRSHKELQFWREAPQIGLTGVAEIEIGERGVAAERVAYDLKLGVRHIVPRLGLALICLACAGETVDGLHIRRYAMFDQELQESIQAFKAIGAEIELQPIVAFLAATRPRTVLDGSAVQRQQPTGTLPEPIEPTLKIRSNMSKATLRH